MPETSPSKYYVTAGWEDVPHLDEKTKNELRQSTPEHLRAAREKGEPSLGAGAVYPIAPETFRVAPFVIPAHFRRGYGLDVGWNRTAAAFGAHDLDNDILYLIGEHYRGQAEPSIHADAIKHRPRWQPGFIDPASQGSSQLDGKRLIDEYRGLGLNLILAENAVEAGIMAVHQRLSTGRLKVFSTMANWFDEYRFYIRDEKTGKVVKKNDHLLDATRYLVMSINQMITEPVQHVSLGGGFTPIDSRAGY